MRSKLLIAALLSGVFMAASAVAAPDDKARIITQVEKPAECLSRVAVRKIDGNNTFVSPQGFDLDPGKHTMSGTVALNTGNCPAPRSRGTNMSSYPPIEADFEAGKTYYLGFDHSSQDRTEWGYVIWKVE